MSTELTSPQQIQDELADFVSKMHAATRKLKEKIEISAKACVEWTARTKKAQDYFDALEVDDPVYESVQTLLDFAIRQEVQYEQYNQKTQKQLQDLTKHLANAQSMQQALNLRKSVASLKATMSTGRNSSEETEIDIDAARRIIYTAQGLLELDA